MAASVAGGRVSCVTRVCGGFLCAFEPESARKVVRSSMQSQRPSLLRCNTPFAATMRADSIETALSRSSLTVSTVTSEALNSEAFPDEPVSPIRSKSVIVADAMLNCQSASALIDFKLTAFDANNLNLACVAVTAKSVTLKSPSAARPALKSFNPQLNRPFHKRLSFARFRFFCRKAIV